MGEKNADDFWNLNYAAPKRKLRAFSRDTGTVRLDFDGGSEGKDAACEEIIRSGPGKDSAAPSAKPRPDDGVPQTGRPAGTGAVSPRKPTLDELKRGGHVVTGGRLLPRESEKHAPGATKAAGSVSIGETTAASPEELRRRGDPYLSYKPEDNRLIREVKISMWPSPYTFYERFRSDARRYYNHPAHECEPVPFFSFMPQYAQLNSDQRAWYFRWRSLVRGGKYPAADFGYVMLYIYELINLSDTLEPSAVLNTLCDVWLGYREAHPRLDRYLSEWVCDLCLINRLKLPYERLKPIYPQIIAAARFKEFYVGCDASIESPFAEALFEFNSGYDWRRSKYLTDANRALFEEHIRGAFLYACQKLEAGSGQNTPSADSNPATDLLGSALRSYGAGLHSIRDAYSGALCSYEIKRRIEIDYNCCTRSPELRFIVTDMIKYAENNVRAMLSIKSRFNTPNLPLPARVEIYNYFAPYRVKPGRKGEDPPEYEKQYESKAAALSPEAALELERRSWETTDRLINAFGGDGAAGDSQSGGEITERVQDASADVAAGRPGRGRSRALIRREHRNRARRPGRLRPEHGGLRARLQAHPGRRHGGY